MLWRRLLSLEKSRVSPHPAGAAAAAALSYHDHVVRLFHELARVGGRLTDATVVVGGGVAEKK